MTYAYGVYISSTADGDFDNSGTISATIETIATATADDASATADYAYSAYGVDMSTLDDGRTFTNSGTISASSLAIATANGVTLAVASGAIASGCGYVVWYAALQGLTATRAATVQLSVPIIAAFGGVLILSEPITLRLLLASAATLGGVLIVLSQRAAKTLR